MASHITTTVIGSLPRPAWLVQDDNIRLWRLGGEALRQGKDDAARLAIRDQEIAGIDVITDGEQRRMHYISRFVSSLSGIDAQRSNYADVEEGTVNRASPIVTGEMNRKHAYALEDLRFLKAHTDRRVKMTMPGPMTAMYWLTNEYYPSDADLGMAMARALHEEMLDLQAEGCDVIQLDEPQAIQRPDAFREMGARGPRPRLRGDRDDDVRSLLSRLSARQRDSDGAGRAAGRNPRQHAPPTSVRVGLDNSPSSAPAAASSPSSSPDFQTTRRSSSVSWTSGAPPSRILGALQKRSDALSVFWAGTGCGRHPIAGSCGFRSTRPEKSSASWRRAPSWHPDDPLRRYNPEWQLPMGRRNPHASTRPKSCGPWTTEKSDRLTVYG